jgi:hypothetical protein
MTRLLWLAFFLFLATGVHAQNTTCATRAPGDNSNACASTAFVHAATGGTIPITVPNGGTGQSSFTANLPLIGNGTGAIGQGTVQGNTTSFAVTTGVFTSGHCRTTDSNGNEIDAGFACNSGSGSGTVNSGTAGQLAYYSSSGPAVSGTFAPNFLATGNWYVDNGANITRWNDQFLVGGATVWAGHPGYTGAQDWLSTAQHTDGVLGGGSVQFASLAALTEPSSAGAANESGLLGGAQSLYSTSAGASTIAVNGFAFNNNEQWVGTGHISGTTFTIDTTTSGTVAIGQYLQINGALAIQIASGSGSVWTLASSGGTVSTTVLFTSLQTAAWGLYSECHRQFASVGQCTGIEVDVRNLADEVFATPYTVGTSPTNGHITDGVSSGCGAGIVTGSPQPCTSAFVIFANPAKWDTGIMFASGSINSTTGGALSAIAMPENYDINWFNPSNTIVAAVSADSSGNLILNTTAGIIVAGSPGKTCSAGLTSLAAFRSVYGIVTGGC